MILQCRANRNLVRLVLCRPIGTSIVAPGSGTQSQYSTASRSNSTGGLNVLPPPFRPIAFPHLYPPISFTSSILGLLYHIYHRPSTDHRCRGLLAQRCHSGFQTS